MGGNVRIYKMPDGRLIGFYREQGGYMMYAKIPLSDQVVFAYMNPNDDDRFELVGATREPKSRYGTLDHVTIIDRRTGAVRNYKAEYIGYAYEAGQNRYKLSTRNMEIKW